MVIRELLDSTRKKLTTDMKGEFDLDELIRLLGAEAPKEEEDFSQKGGWG